MSLDIYVEFELDNGPLDDFASWTNVGSITSCSIRRGRTSEFDKVQAGSASVLINTTNRNLDPENLSGSWYGRWTTGTPMRIRMNASGSASTLWTGYLDSVTFTETDPSDTVAAVTLTGSDALKVLATPARRYQQRVLIDQPIAYWRLNERDGETTMYDSSTWARDGAYAGTPTGIDGLAADSDGGKHFTDSSIYAYVEGAMWMPGPLMASLAHAAFSVEFWCDIAGIPDGDAAALFEFYRTSKDWITVYGFGTDDTIGAYLAADLWQRYREVSNALPAGTHHVVVTWDQTTLRVYVDGTSLTGSSGSGFPSEPSVEAGKIVIGRPLTAATWCKVDEVAVYDYELSAADIAKHYQAGSWSGVELTSDRIDRVLDLVGFPSGLRSISTGVGSVGVQSAEVDALEEIRDAEAAEQGLFFADKDGTVRFLPRYYAAAASSAMTISDATATYHLASAPRSMTEAFLINEVAVTWDQDRSPVIRSDETSIARHGVRAAAYTLLMETRTAAKDLADYLLLLYSEPVMRLGQVTMWFAGPTGTLSDYGTITGRDLGDRVTIVRQPLNTGTTISADFIVQGISYELSLTGPCSATFDVTPAPVTTFMTLDDNALGLLDSGNLIGL